MGPTPGLLAQLEAEGQSQEATELREELLDRPPNRWYQSGFLIPSETSLGDRADDAADDEFAGLDGQNLSAKRKSNANGDDTGASEGGPARRVFFPCSIGLSLLIPQPQGWRSPHWASYKPMPHQKTAKPTKPGAANPR